MQRIAGAAEIGVALTERLGGRLRADGELRSRCPYHRGGQVSFGVNVIKGVFRCWSSRCGKAGTLNSLLVHLGIPLKAAERAHGTEAALKEVADRRLESLPKELLFLFDDGVVPGFAPDLCKRFGILWDPREERLVFPVFVSPKPEREPSKDTVLVGLYGRLPNPQPWQGKYKLYRKELGPLTGLDTDNLPLPRSALWGEQLLGRGGTAIMVEGFKACMAVDTAGLPTFATMGTSVTPEQFDAMCLRFDEIITFFDADSAGETGAAIAAAKLHGRCLVRQVQWTDEDREAKRQPDDLTAERIRTMTEEAELPKYNTRRKAAARRKSQGEKYDNSSGGGKFSRVYAGKYSLRGRFLPVKVRESVGIKLELVEVVTSPPRGAKYGPGNFHRCFCPGACPVHSKLAEAEGKAKFVFAFQIEGDSHLLSWTENYQDSNNETKISNKKAHKMCGGPRCEECSNGNPKLTDFIGVMMLSDYLNRCLDAADLKRFAVRCGGCLEKIYLQEATCPDCEELLYQFNPDDPSTVWAPDTAVTKIYEELLLCETCSKPQIAVEEVQCFKADGETPGCADPERDVLHYNLVELSMIAETSARGRTFMSLDVLPLGEKRNPEEEEPFDASAFVDSFERACEKMGVNPATVKANATGDPPEGAEDDIPF